MIEQSAGSGLPITASRELDLVSGWLSQTAELERLARRFAALTSALPGAVLVLTRARVLYASERAGQVLDVDVAALPRMPLRTLVPDPVAHASLRAALDQAWNGAPADIDAIPLLRRDGTRALVSIALRPLPGELEPTLLVVVEDRGHDQTRAMADAASDKHDTLRAFGLYLAGLANDLRGPLTAYLSHLNLLTQRRDLPSDVREALDLYRDVTAETLHRFGRAMEWGRRLPIGERVDLETVVGAAAETMGAEAVSAGIRITLDLSAVPPVAGSADQLQLAVEHVLRNACEALGERRGDVVIALRASAERVALVVADNGVGIPDSLLPHVFDPFSSSKSIATGLGLGLAIVKDIVERHGGRVTIISGRAGTAVSFTFAALTTVEAPEPRTGARRLLLVDDNPELLATYRVALTRAGYELLTASDADEALALVVSAAPDACIIDVQMSGRDGLAFVEAIATWHPHLLGRIVLHTAYAHEDRVRAAAEGFGVALLEKPCQFSTLAATVERVLDG